MAMATTGQWIKFFLDAGIPSGVASKYATIFHENRIKVDMLLDLNKEYLKDMGITVMGDIIAILKYAKETHEKVVQEKVLGPDSSASSSSKVPNRILGHFMNKNAQNFEVEAKDTIDGKISLVNIKRKTANVEVVPVKKVRRVLPEQEGGYIVKMPTGSTPKTKKLINEAVSGKKQSVFERLGESNVTSTTDSQQFTVTGLNSPLVRSSKGIFSHLGPSNNYLRHENIGEKEINGGLVSNALGYRGILKHIGIQKPVDSPRMARQRVSVTPVGLQTPSKSRKIISFHTNGLVKRNDVSVQGMLSSNSRATRKIIGPGSQRAFISATRNPIKTISYTRQASKPTRNVFSRLGDVKKFS